MVGGVVFFVMRCVIRELVDGLLAKASWSMALEDVCSYLGIGGSFGLAMLGRLFGFRSSRSGHGVMNDYVDCIRISEYRMLLSPPSQMPLSNLARRPYRVEDGRIANL